MAIKDYNYAYGLAGGVLGTVFAGPMLAFDVWMRFTRKLNPLKILFAPFVIVPALFLGTLLSPLVGIICGYQCAKHKSLEPFTRSFSNFFASNDEHQNFKRRFLSIYLVSTVVLAYMASFVFLNILTSGAFSLLAIPGKAIIMPIVSNIASSGHPLQIIGALASATVALAYFTAVFSGLSLLIYEKLRNCTGANDEPLLNVDTPQAEYRQFVDEAAEPAQAKQPTCFNMFGNCFGWGKKPEAAPAADAHAPAARPVSMDF